MALIISNSPTDSIIKVKEVNFQLLYLIPDPYVLNPTTYKAIVKLSAMKNFLIIAPSEIFLKIGGHIAIEPDFDKAGKYAGRLMNEFLSQGKQDSLHLPIKGLIINEKEMRERKYITPKGYTIKSIKGGGL